ncbi:MAG: NosD domain-containing protein [Euryarchaeota archaeon]|nr:NosD domain-containing protein [Euryarchaeota archaeon]
MKKQILYFMAVVLLLNLIITGICTAEKELPDESQKQGHLMANGTYFELNNSQYLNITLYSSNPIELTLKSIPEMVTIRIESITDAVSTQITLTGFEPLTTYHKYEDDYHNLTSFITDSDGKYSYNQDLTKGHIIFILPGSGTKSTTSSTLSPLSTVKYILDDATGGDCTSIGNWDSSTKTCTLTTDFSGTIQIDSDNIKLDGDGHILTGNGTGHGVFFNCKNGITIRELGIRDYSYGIYLGDGAYSYLLDNKISDNIDGISLSDSNNITISNNLISDNSDGISLNVCWNNTITDNTFSNNLHDSIYSIHNIRNIIVNNDASDNGGGFSFWYDPVDYEIRNNIIDSIFIDCGGNNLLIGNRISNGSGIILYFLSHSNSIVDNIILNNSNGITIEGCHYNNITGNNISNNNCGIYFGDRWGFAYDNSITNNIISNNNYGINISNGYDNLIYENVFDNSIYNAYESLDSYDNEWDNGSIGNQWFDFDESCEGCIDADNDGICDSFYYIPGGSGIDHYPIIQWIYMWIGEGSDGGSAITTSELQAAIHHWLEDIPVRGHILSTSDIQHIIALWLSE